MLINQIGRWNDKQLGYSNEKKNFIQLKKKKKCDQIEKFCNLYTTPLP